jgi:hypothetical protein
MGHSSAVTIMTAPIFKIIQVERVNSALHICIMRVPMCMWRWDIPKYIILLHSLPYIYREMGGHGHRELPQKSSRRNITMTRRRCFYPICKLVKYTLLNMCACFAWPAVWQLANKINIYTSTLHMEQQKSELCVIVYNARATHLFERLLGRSKWISASL